MSDTEEAVVPDADTNQGVIEAAEGEGEDAGPVVLQPRVVQYCGRCGLPLEYCEFGPTPEECARGESGEALEDAAVVEGVLGFSGAHVASNAHAAEDESAAGERATKKKSKKGAQVRSAASLVWRVELTPSRQRAWSRSHGCSATSASSLLWCRDLARLVR